MKIERKIELIILTLFKIDISRLLTNWGQKGPPSLKSVAHILQ